MSHCRRFFAFIALALAVGSTGLTGCGRSAENPALDRRVVTTSPTATVPTLAPPTRHEAPEDTWARKHAGNNGFKQHYELAPQDQELADAAARRLRPKLRRLQADGDLSREALRKALVDSGLEPIDVVSRTDPPRDGSLVFWSRLRGGICVDGKLTAEAVSIRTEGPSLDGGCKERGGGH